MFRQQDLLVFPRLVPEFGRSKNGPPVYRLEWREFLNACASRKDYLLNKHVGVESGFLSQRMTRNIEAELWDNKLDIPEEALTRLESFRYRIGDHALDELRRNVRRAIDEWNVPRRTVPKRLANRLLGPAIEHVSCAFLLLVDCLWSADTQSWDKVNRHEAEALMLSIFWGSIAGYPEAGGRTVPICRSNEEQPSPIYDAIKNLLGTLPENVAAVIEKNLGQDEKYVRSLSNKLMPVFESSLSPKNYLPLLYDEWMEKSEKEWAIPEIREKAQRFFDGLPEDWAHTGASEVPLSQLATAVELLRELVNFDILNDFEDSDEDFPPFIKKLLSDDRLDKTGVEALKNEASPNPRNIALDGAEFWHPKHGFVVTQDRPEDMPNVRPVPSYASNSVDRVQPSDSDQQEDQDRLPECLAQKTERPKFETGFGPKPLKVGTSWEDKARTRKETPRPIGRRKDIKQQTGESQ